MRSSPAESARRRAPTTSAHGVSVPPLSRMETCKSGTVASASLTIIATSVVLPEPGAARNRTIGERSRFLSKTSNPMSLPDAVDMMVCGRGEPATARSRPTRATSEDATSMTSRPEGVGSASPTSDLS